MVGDRRILEGPSKIESKIVAMVASLQNHGDHGMTTVPSTPNYVQNPVNRTSEPCEADGLGLFHHPSGVTMPHLWTVDRISCDPEGVELQGNQNKFSLGRNRCEAN